MTKPLIHILLTKPFSAGHTELQKLNQQVNQTATYRVWVYDQPLEDLNTIGVLDIKPEIDQKPDDKALLNRLLNANQAALARQFLKIVILKKYGGIFLDPFYLPLVPDLVTLWSKYDFFCCVDPLINLISDQILMCSQNHPVLETYTRLFHDLVRKKDLKKTANLQLKVATLLTQSVLLSAGQESFRDYVLWGGEWAVS